MVWFFGRHARNRESRGKGDGRRRLQAAQVGRHDWSQRDSRTKEREGPRVERDTEEGTQLQPVFFVALSAPFSVSVPVCLSLVYTSSEYTHYFLPHFNCVQRYQFYSVSNFSAIFYTYKLHFQLFDSITLHTFTYFR